MHCGSCGTTTVEVRPCCIEPHAYIGVPVIEHLSGDIWLCQKCVAAIERLPLTQSRVESEGRLMTSFVAWLGYPCDTCSTMTAFDGPIDGLPEGIICEECLPATVMNGGGKWMCAPCFERDHTGHRQRAAVPLLDLLARELGRNL